ncbi:Hypothetical predicted protein [Olea europaea subsp. europaea]|uniref:RIN4 pathogenic type III effector avirulence factor Avr cleavage site domain-containing protein n=2 Tax=Olea europaea subsp. europaea TaxID=158383 RepID=A0A8S0PQB5_OLEEU|nr:Hypothetical predicted protein [Olea europaea subsp. europaea]
MIHMAYLGRWPTLDLAVLSLSLSQFQKESKTKKRKLFGDLSLSLQSPNSLMEDKGRPLPKFGEWDVNDPASAEGFTVIFNKARNEKRTGGKSDSPPKDDSTYKHGETLGKPHSKKWFCCMQSTSAES